jgi:hypothetical protein
LKDHGLTRNDTRVNLSSADLVLATRSDNAAAPTDTPLGPDLPLQKIIGDGRLTMCNPADHPAGKPELDWKPTAYGNPSPTKSPLPKVHQLQWRSACCAGLLYRRKGHQRHQGIGRLPG